MHVGFDFVALVALYVTIAAVLDYRTRKIPNWLTVSAALLGLAYNSFALGGLGPLTAIAGFVVGFGLLLLPWLLGGGGMGDVKLLAALGAWLGPVVILVSFGLAAMLAALAAVIIMSSAIASVGYSRTRRKYVQAGAADSTAPGSPPAKARRVLPFAVPVAVSTWLVLAWLVLRSAGA
jgi:prepilin peptidase CpaA